MGTGVVVTTNGKKMSLNRIFKSMPDYSSPSVFKVGTGTDTPSITDTDLQTAVTIAGNPTKAIVTGYPLIDESTLQVKTRALLSTTDCIGDTITEFGLFNSDLTPMIFSRLVHTAVVKTDSLQIIYIEKDKWR
jgi:hypothetical protein